MNHVSLPSAVREDSWPFLLALPYLSSCPCKIKLPHANIQPINCPAFLPWFPQLSHKLDSQHCSFFWWCLVSETKMGLGVLVMTWSSLPPLCSASISQNYDSVLNP